jgi:hypothetical protein
MECCSGVTTSRAEFLTLKLSNFKAYLEPFCATEDQKATLHEYATLEAAMPFILQAVALRSAGAPLPVEAFVSKFSLEDKSQADRAAFANKVERYINMFCDVLTS